MAESDILIFAENVRQNTDADFCVYTETGEYLSGSDRRIAEPTDFDGVYQDAQRSRTLFKFRYKNKNYIGSVQGTGASSQSYAFFICELADQSSGKANLSKEDFFKALLLGEASYYTIQKYARKYFKEGRSCVIILQIPTDKIEDVMEVVRGYADGSDDYACALNDSQCAYVKVFGEEDEYRSVTEYAEFLVQSVYEEAGIRISAYIGGTVENVADLSTSFSQALATKRISVAVSNRPGVHSFKEYILIKMLEDLPKYKLSEYLGMILDPSAREIFDDPEMLSTAEEFLENSLNVSETARKLYLHRNTLNYRLDKIEKATGLNIRKISDATTFRMITVLIKLVR